MSIRKIEFTDANFDAETSTGLSVVCFEEPSDYDSQRQAGIIAEAAGKIPEVITVGKCDIERCSELARRFGVTSIPTTIVFKNGSEVERLVGFRHRITFIKHFEADAAK